MEVLLLVPDGVGIRNYLYSDFLSELTKLGATIHLYHKVSDAAIKEIATLHSEVLCDEIPTFIEEPLPRFLRETTAYARLVNSSKKLDNKSVLDFWIIRPKTIKQKVLYKGAVLLGKWLSNHYKLIKKCEKIYNQEIKKSIAYKNCIIDLKKIKPDLVLNLHQRASNTAPIILAAESLGIKTATVIFSWDNVPKGRLISRPNFYFVWSDLMKHELSLLYPEIEEKQIFVVGSPQFEFYKKSAFYFEKEVFFKKYGLNVNKKTICYSGDDIASSPYDQIYLQDLCDQIMLLPEEKRPQIIFRRCPVDFSNRFDEVLKKYDFLIKEIKPDWRVEKNSDINSFSLIYPAHNDLYLLVNTCLHSDLVINLGSTMAHDFAVFDKPCLYLNYNPVIDSKWSVEKIYAFQHFRSMKGLNAVGWINNKEEFIEKVLHCIEKPEEVGVDRKIWFEKILKHPIENNSVELANLIVTKCTSVS